MVLVSTVLSAQTYRKVHSTQSANWNGNTWIYDDVESTDLVITMKGKTVLINDQAHSTYYCYAYNKNDSWFAFDEKDRKCLLSISSVDDDMCLTVMYGDVLIRYFY